MDLQKQLKDIGRQKEDVIREMAYATDEQRDFLNQKAKNLDNLLNELKTDLNRTALNMEYLREVADKKGDLKASRKDEILLGIDKKPPVVLLKSPADFGLKSPADFQADKSPPKSPEDELSPKQIFTPGVHNLEEVEKEGKRKKGKASLLSEVSTRPLEDEAEEVARRREEEYMPEAMRARNKIYDEYKKGRLPREHAVQALANTRQRFGVRASDNPFFSIKSFDEDY